MPLDKETLDALNLIAKGVAALQAIGKYEEAQLPHPVPEPQAWKKLVETGMRNDGPFTDEYVETHRDTITNIYKAIGEYAGTSTFVVAMRRRVEDHLALTIPQLRGAANIIYREATK